IELRQHAFFGIGADDQLPQPTALSAEAPRLLGRAVELQRVRAIAMAIGTERAVENVLIDRLPLRHFCLYTLAGEITFRTTWPFASNFRAARISPGSQT